MSHTQRFRLSSGIEKRVQNRIFLIITQTILDHTEFLLIEAGTRGVLI